MSKMLKTYMVANTTLYKTKYHNICFCLILCHIIYYNLIDLNIKGVKLSMKKIRIMALIMSLILIVGVLSALLHC